MTAAAHAPSSDEQKDHQALAAFVVDNADLERLEASLVQFNIFEALGVTHQELRHSDFLAYLLDPRKPHGLGDAFVRLFLQRALVTADPRSAAINPIDLAVWSLDRLMVLREWRFIDILLVDDEHQFVVIIENKLWSGEQRRQLEWYLETVSEQYRGWKRLALYLTPGRSTPSCDEYLPIDYRLVCSVVEDLAERNLQSVDPAVPLVLSHYARMLRRHVVADSDIAELCRNIYRKHQRALDLIFEHRPDDQDAMREFLEELITSRTDLALINSRKDHIVFCVTEWERPERKDGQWWTPSGEVLLFGLSNATKHMDLVLWIGPGRKEKRDALLERVREAGRPFGLKGPHGRNWTTVFSRRFLRGHDYEVFDLEERQKRVREQWDAFLTRDLPLFKERLGPSGVVDSELRDAAS